MKLILITGSTSTGKTFLSNKLVKILGKEKVNLISMDDYYYPETYYNNKENINWDIPQAYNLEQFEKDVLNLLDQKEIQKNIFLYGKNIYSNEKEVLIPKEYLIVEGIFSFYNEKILRKANYKIVLSSWSYIRYLRRKKRDKKLEPNFKNKKFKLYWKKYVKTYDDYYFPLFEKEGKVIYTNFLEFNKKGITKILLKEII